MNIKANLFALALVSLIPGASIQPVLAQGGSDAAQAYSADERAFLDTFITRTGMASATVPGNVAVGMQMPANLQYHNIEGHARFRGNRYTHVNNNHVIVDNNNRVIAIHRHR
ncbi:MAG: hypothetical protein J0H01_37950 [Rhizobiales bacterium]|nr:hypothetical protein [Hyphomicrobiales bacterium]